MFVGKWSVLLSITDTVDGFLAPYITKVMDALAGFPIWLQGVVLLSLAIFTLVGLFVFIKKFIKLFLVLAVLGAIGYFLYDKGVLDGILDAITGATIGSPILSAIRGVLLF